MAQDARPRPASHARCVRRRLLMQSPRRCSRQRNGQVRGHQPVFRWKIEDGCEDSVIHTHRAWHTQLLGAHLNGVETNWSLPQRYALAVSDMLTASRAAT